MSAFDRPLPICSGLLYDDNIAEMKTGLPELVEKCKRLSVTELGQKFALLRLPIVVLASNKLEGTLSDKASEGDTFKVILNFLQLSEEETPRKSVAWNEEGQNESSEAWYSQCVSHAKGLKMMVGLAQEGKPLDADVLLECHNVLMGGALTEKGQVFQSRFRAYDEPVVAGNFTFPNFTNHKDDLEHELQELNARFGSSHPVAWASDLMIIVLTLHPFLNGNGRLARLCFAYGLIRHGVPCAVVFSDWHSKARSHYIRAIQEAQGQRGGTNKYEKLYSMGVTGLYMTLSNMLLFCKSS